MGLRIGPAASAIASLRVSGNDRPTRSVAPDAPEGEGVRLVQRAEAPPVQAGFGENSLSPSGAALVTLDSNLAEARELVPTVAELRERSRVVQSERRAEAPTPRPTERPDTLQRRESVRPEPNAAVQNFASDTGAVERPERPAETEETPNGTEPAPDRIPPPSARIDFRV